MADNSEYDGRMVAAQRNIESLFSAVNHFEAARVADAKRVEDLMATLAQQNEQIGRLTQQLAHLQATMYEAGVR